MGCVGCRVARTAKHVNFVQSAAALQSAFDHEGPDACHGELALRTQPETSSFGSRSAPNRFSSRGQMTRCHNESRPLLATWVRTPPRTEIRMVSARPT